MTEGQLRSKRDEFWDTAPAFEGRKEIWDALRAAASAFEGSDHLLAQAILDGASITLPHGNTAGGFSGIRGSICRILSSVRRDFVGIPRINLYAEQWLSASRGRRVSSTVNDDASACIQAAPAGETAAGQHHADGHPF